MWGEERNTCRVWLGNLKETDRLGRPRHKFGGGVFAIIMDI